MEPNRKNPEGSPASGTDGPGPDPRALQRQIGELCQRCGLADMYVFGSRASEIAARVNGHAFAAAEDLPGSDVDVAVRPLPGGLLDVDAVVELASELERMLGVPRVDVVLLPTVNPFLALEAIRGKLLFCADSDEQAEYELYVLRRAGDLAPFQRLRQRLALSRYLDR